MAAAFNSQPSTVLRLSARSAQHNQRGQDPCSEVGEGTRFGGENAEQAMRLIIRPGREVYPIRAAAVSAITGEQRPEPFDTDRITRMVQKLALERIGGQVEGV